MTDEAPENGPGATADARSTPHQRFSVVVCTRNRERFLDATLESLLAQRYPPDLYEVIVVDNGSTDGTRALVERKRADALMEVSYVLENRTGTSLTRNAGFRNARHEYVAYLDDDAIAAPGWLAAYDAAITAHGARAAGGPVIPMLEPDVRPPVWWSLPAVRSVFEVAHEIAADGGIVPIRWPLWLGGCNAVYAKALLQEHGGFRADCGPVGARYRVAEDIDLNARLERAGVPIHYVGGATVKHRITAERMTRRFLWRRAVSAGVTDAAVARVLGVRAHAPGVAQLAGAALRMLLTREPARMAACMRVGYGVGHMRGRFSSAARRSALSRSDGDA